MGEKNVPLISVIVPVYKVERYLHRCVDSLLGQTYPKIEIVLVDDGSPDGCPGICDKYAKNNKNVRVIHKANGGQSSARNVGIKEATGDYIGFVDSDDWVNTNAYAYAYHLMQKYSADAVQFDFTFSSGEVKSDRNRPIVERVYKEKEILQFFMTSSTKTGDYSLWRMLLKRKLVDGLRFREGKINEDIDYKYKILSRCGVLADSSRILYYYFQESESTTRGGLKKKDYDLFDAADELCRLADRETYGTIRKLAYVKKARTPFSLLCKISYYGIADPELERQETIRQLMAEHRKNVAVLLGSPIPMSRKVLAASYAVSFPATNALVKIARRIVGYK